MWFRASRRICALFFRNGQTFVAAEGFFPVIVFFADVLSTLGALGNSTSRIIVEEQLGRNIKLTYATNVNTTSQQLIQAEVAINRHVSVLIAHDESGVFSMVIKATRRYK